MKRKTRNTARHIIAAMLTLAIALTGISFGDTATAYAKDREGLENFADMQGKTITMKIGDTKAIDFGEEKSYGFFDETNAYDWTTSDASIVSLVNEYYLSVAGNVKTSYFVIRAEKAGTAVITGTVKTTGETVSCTIIVEEPEMTAKQKACKHKWKTTKKATCLMSGMKTCKRCKLQKTITKKEHKFVIKYDSKSTRREYIVYVCNGCLSDDPETRRQHDSTTSKVPCKEVCGAEFSERTYGSVEAAREAYNEHRSANKHGHSVAQTIEYGELQVGETVAVMRCKTCGNTPEAIEKYYK